MNEQQNLQTVQEGYSLFNRADIPNLLKIYTDDVEFIIPGPPEIIPYAGVYWGKEQLTTFFTKLHDAVMFDRFEPTDYIAQNEKVAVLGYMRGRVRATGQTMQEEWAHAFLMRAGKVCRFQVFADTAVTVRAFQPHETLAH